MKTPEPIPVGQELENLLKEALEKLDLMRGEMLHLEAHCIDKKSLALQAFGLFWAENFPSEELPSSKFIDAVDRCSGANL